MLKKKTVPRVFFEMQQENYLTGSDKQIDKPIRCIVFLVKNLELTYLATEVPN